MSATSRTRAQWLDLLQRCQNGDASCLYVLGEIERELAAANALAAGLREDKARLDLLEKIFDDPLRPAGAAEVQIRGRQRDLILFGFNEYVAPPDMSGIRFVGQARNPAKERGEAGPSYVRIQGRTLRETIDAIDAAMRADAPGVMP